MSRKLKMKRQIIEEANRRLLGEQNEKISKEEIDDIVSSIQGVVAVEVEPGDSIYSIVKKSREPNGLSFLDFMPNMNTHIKDPDKIYPGDVLFFMTDPTRMGFRTPEEVDEFIRQEKGIDKGRIDYLRSQDPDMFK
jgi:hypothetical protein